VTPAELPLGFPPDTVMTRKQLALALSTSEDSIERAGIPASYALGSRCPRYIWGMHRLDTSGREGRMIGSLPIDLQFRGVGRIHVLSGTTKRQVRDAMKQMLRTLYQVGRLDILRDIKTKRLTVMTVYERYRTGQLHELPTGDLMRPLRLAWADWPQHREIADRTRRDYEEACSRLAAAPDATFTDLPALLTAHRKACLGIRARTFNKDRAAVLAFVHSELGEAHWLAIACRRVDTLKIAKDRRLPFNPLTVDQRRRSARSSSPTTPGLYGHSASPGCGPRRCSRRSGTRGPWRPMASGSAAPSRRLPIVSCRA
jgi:hypothetical protein